MNIFDVGDRVDLGWTVEANGVPEAPAAVSCTVRRPNDTTVALTVTGSNGVYEAAVIPNMSGTWSYEWTGTGGNVDSATDTGTFYVRQRLV